MLGDKLRHKLAHLVIAQAGGHVALEDLRLARLFGGQLGAARLLEDLRRLQALFDLFVEDGEAILIAERSAIAVDFLMGEAVEPRRDFIESNALKVANLDI